MVYQTTSLTIVYSTIYSDADKRKFRPGGLVIPPGRIASYSAWADYYSARADYYSARAD